MAPLALLVMALGGTVVAPAGAESAATEAVLEVSPPADLDPAGGAAGGPGTGAQPEVATHPDGSVVDDDLVPEAFAADEGTTTTPAAPTAPPSTTTAPAGGGAAADGSIVGGEMVWGFKASFRSYVVGPGGGSITMTPPATQDPDNGPFRFPLGEEAGAFDQEVVDAAFAGAARFQAHAGVLDVTLADPEVDIDGDAGTLIADVNGDPDVPVADLDLREVEPTASGDVVTIADIPATLTEEGAAAFSGSGGGYEAGERLDPVTLILQVEGELGDLPAPAPPAAGADLVSCTPTSAAAGSAIQVCGAGFLPGEQVRIFLHSTPVQIGLTTADEAGAVRASITLPASSPTGQHRIELRGVTSGRSIFSAPFAVSAAAGTLPATGHDAGPLTGVAAALLVAGGLAATARRRLPATTR